MAKMPRRDGDTPAAFSPSTNPGPAEMPTIAIDTFNPTDRAVAGGDDGRGEAV